MPAAGGSHDLSEIKIGVLRILEQALRRNLAMQGVQAYFSGHEHNLQYMHVDSHTTHYIVSGAGSLTDYPATYW